MHRFTILMIVFEGLATRGWAQAQAPEDTAVVEARHLLEQPRLSESSALIASREQPGVLWTLNDSGNPPELFAIDTSGRNLGVFGVQGVENRDWEALGYGSCGRHTCLYIGDTGDNQSRYPAARIYRVLEPAVRSGEPGRDIRPTGILTIVYPDGPQDIEAIFLAPTSDLYLISKGRSRGVHLYRVPASSWATPTASTVAEKVEELPIPARRGSAYHVTDASIAEDGVNVAVRTYGFIYFFRLQGKHLMINPDRPTCRAGMDIQGEGIAWLPGGRLATTSEQVVTVGKTISIIKC